MIAQVPWDARVTNINSVKTELRRSIPLVQESISATDLHVFADTSIAANCAAVVQHAVVYQLHSVIKSVVSREFPNTTLQFQDSK